MMITMTNAYIRLACELCGRDDKDYITPEPLEQCIAEGLGLLSSIGRPRKIETPRRTPPLMRRT
jgi:hypothetical protein